MMKNIHSLTAFIQMLLIVDSSLVFPSSNNATVIGHPSSGIFFQYIGEYVPSDFIINITIVIPLTAAYCNIFPLHMALSIPKCAYIFSSTDHSRQTRQVGEGWIAMGIATVGTGLATANRFEISSLKKKINHFSNQIAQTQYTADITSARVVHLKDGVMKLGAELKNTQQLFYEYREGYLEQNRSISTMNHSLGILGNHVNKFEHKVKNRFLTQAINDISNGRTSLSMIDPDDLPIFISQLLNETDETSRKLFLHLPITQIITNLLIAQQFTFVLPTVYQRNDTREIGRLILTNFFAVPRPNISYSIYEIKIIPYFFENSFIRVTELPIFIGHCAADGTYLEFYSEDTKMCTFNNWTTCKDHPPILQNFGNPCIQEILTRNTTSTCTISEVPMAKFFIHQLTGSYWLLSFKETQDCIKMPLQLNAHSTYHAKLITKNIRVTLPSVALVSVPPMTTIVCEDFSLVGRSFSTKNSGILYLLNGSMNRIDIDIFHVQMNLHQNWNPKPYNSNSIDSILNFINQTPSTPSPPIPFSYFPIVSFNSQFIFILLSIVVVIFVAIILYFIRSIPRKLFRLLHRQLQNPDNISIDLEHLDHYSADQLKAYYEKIKQQNKY